MAKPPPTPRPTFYDDPASDRLAAIITALTTEVAVLQERLHTLEAVLANHGLVGADAIEDFSPSPEQAAERVQRQQALTDRVFYVLQEEIDRLDAQTRGE